MLCDGDSKAFDAETDLNVYGPGNLIQKEDCINHVSKRMGTALTNLVASSKAQKDSVSGKGNLTLQKVAKMLTIINYTPSLHLDALALTAPTIILSPASGARRVISRIV